MPSSHPGTQELGYRPRDYFSVGTFLCLCVSLLRHTATSFSDLSTPVFCPSRTTVVLDLLRPSQERISGVSFVPGRLRNQNLKIEDSTLCYLKTKFGGSNTLNQYHGVLCPCCLPLSFASVTDSSSDTQPTPLWSRRRVLNQSRTGGKARHHLYSPYLPTTEPSLPRP